MEIQKVKSHLKIFYEQDNCHLVNKSSEVSTNQIEELINQEDGNGGEAQRVDSEVNGTASTSIQTETLWVEGLVPGIDFCNHDLKAAATWEVDGTGSVAGVPFSMYLLSVGESRTFQNEKEVSISYGNKGNERAELRCLLPKSLLDHGFFPPHSPNEHNDKCKADRICDFSWSGQRGTPSYSSKLVFPENFLAALRTVAMREDEHQRVSSLLEELVGSGGERQPSDTEVRAAVWEASGDSGALQLLVDLLHTKLMDLEENSGTEDCDSELLGKTSTEKLKQHACVENDTSKETNGSNRRHKLMSKNRWSSIVYRRGQKQLTRLFLREAEHALQLALSEGN